MNCGKIRGSHMDAISSIGEKLNRRLWTVWDLGRWIASLSRSVGFAIESRRRNNCILAMRRPKPTQPLDERPTRRDLFLYHLSELERAIERGGIEWDELSAKAAQLRLAKLFMVIMNAAAGTKDH